MSRSPAVVAAALSIVQGGSPDEKLKEIVAGHPHDISPHLWEAVCRVSVGVVPETVAIGKSKYDERWVETSDGQAMSAFINGSLGLAMYFRGNGDCWASVRGIRTTLGQAMPSWSIS